MFAQFSSFIYLYMNIYKDNSELIKKNTGLSISIPK